MDEVTAAAAAAAGAALLPTSREERAAWLDALAAALEDDRAGLVALAAEETHLSQARLDGEVTRTAAQLRFFAGVAREGGYLEATLDSPDPSLIPPRPDLRRMLRPLGPVAVYTSSNFPFAFSVLGNDTASALAAGCPVIVKAHPGHPQLSRRTAELALSVLPAGWFALVEGMTAGVALVQHPAVRAAGFTGSERGGRALFDLAASRPDPIPFYGELGSVNPVVVTRAAARERAAGIGAGLVGSFTRDAGQYCTKPGLVFVPAGEGVDDAVRDALGSAPASRQLTDGMSAAYASAVELFGTDEEVTVLLGTSEPGTSTPAVALVGAADFLAARDAFLEEHFGPITVLVSYREDELPALLATLRPSLTATIHRGTGEDVTALATWLAPIAGRLLFDGWPTGVAIGWAQHHGGSWPATTASIHTSVGATAIRRWLTPIAYQDAPQEVLPPELRDGNPLGIPRRES
ncbi:aldehyde dehydrogenase family protein [Leifsonia shinshuensis]|uniref:Aldehyde dehydrogenase family protein n=1 Tax=Leifsonia shinshuensis TaxID=150026 RepID=A0A7G6Y6S0_9MICO|nr:aldehyde dehydrogenase family protein [Leifsonia shinshuensis]QNE34185.1 aldehyde dehydrogenase family protein [Leifsonia shinshuensis]